MYYFFPALAKNRKERSLSQITVASAIGICQTMYSRCELGQRRVPIEVMLDIADYYGIKVDDLFVGKIKIE